MRSVMKTNPHTIHMVLFDHFVSDTLVSIVRDVGKVPSSLFAVRFSGYPCVRNRYDLVADSVNEKKGAVDAFSMLNVLFWANILPCNVQFITKIDAVSELSF